MHLSAASRSRHTHNPSQPVALHVSSPSSDHSRAVSSMCFPCAAAGTLCLVTVAANPDGKCILCQLWCVLLPPPAALPLPPLYTSTSCLHICALPHTRICPRRLSSPHRLRARGMHRMCAHCGRICEREALLGWRVVPPADSDAYSAGARLHGGFWVQMYSSANAQSVCSGAGR